MMASFRKTAGASAVLAVCLLMGCGGTGETQTTGVQGPPEPRAASPAAPRQGPGEGGQKASAGQRTPALVPDDFERRVLGDRRDAGAVIAPLASGGIKVFGRARPPHAWSTIKPVIVVAVARARHAGELGGGRQLTTSERQLIARAIENSDNVAAAQLFEELGSRAQATAALQQVLVDGGDRRTRVNEQVTRPPFSSYGQTAWPLSEAARFYRQLANGCLADPSDTQLILDDMRNVTAVGGAGWGLPQAGFPTLRLKAGWGPENGQTGYTALQYGIVGDASDGGYVVGIVAETDSDASTAYGEVTDVARRAAAVMRGRRAPVGPARC